MPSAKTKAAAGGLPPPELATSAAVTAEPGVERFFTEKTLTLLATAPGYERGRDYALHLRVVRLRRWRGRLEATVEGRDDYEVRLWDAGQRLGFSCTCPVGQRQQLCKHAVATALTWLSERKAFSRDRPARRSVIGVADVRTHLLTLDKAELVERLLTSAGHSGEQIDALKLEAAWCAAAGPDLPALKHAVRTWMWTGTDARNLGIAPLAVPRLELMIAVCRGLLQSRHGADALALLDCVFRTAPVSSGYRVEHNGDDHRDLLRTFQQLHHDACRQAKPEPDRLARDLIDYEVELDLGVFDGALKSYSALLGRQGRRSYLEQIEDLARAVKPRSPEPGHRFEPGWERRRRLFKLVERLDLGLPPEWYADVLGRESCWPDTAYTIASKFAAAGKAEQALCWVERGLGSTSYLPDARLLGLGVDVCRTQGWHERAIVLVLQEFKRRPCASTFALLRSLGLEAGQWPRWRRRAFRSARDVVAQRRRSGSDHDLDFFGTRRDVSLLVEMHLVDLDLGAARRAARRGYCRDEVWVRLADAMAETDPVEAAMLYELRLRQVLLGTAHDGAQEECTALVAKLGDCLARQGRTERFSEWLTDTLAAHRDDDGWRRLLASYSLN
jgi:hypothetical protein